MVSLYAMDTTGIGGRIKRIIDEKGWTARYVANKAEITEGTLSRYIGGKRMPRGQELARLAAALGVSTDYLLTGKDPEHPSLDQFQDMLTRAAQRSDISDPPPPDPDEELDWANALQRDAAGGQVQHYADTTKIPIAEKAWAGTPWPLPDEEIAGYITLPAEWLRGEVEMVAVTVIGNSFIDEYIQNGDVVVIVPNDSYSDGQLVLCRVHGDVPCLKRIYHTDGRLILETHGDGVRPVVEDTDHVHIVGKVMFVCRKI